MVNIRPLAPGDVGGVVSLFETVFPEHRWRRREDCEAYCHEIFFRNPWTHLAVPSWVALHDEHVIGFAGVLPRPMSLNGRALRAAVGCQFLVHPTWRPSLVAFRLLQSVLRSDQDVFLSDGSNDASRQLCRAVGGTAPLAQNLHWLRPLRPARLALSLFSGTRTLRALGVAARLPCAAVDAWVARLRPNRFQHRDTGLDDRPLDARTLHAFLQEHGAGSSGFRFCYDEQSLTWLLAQAAQKTRHGNYRARAVFDDASMLGYFAYYAQAGSVNEVLAVSARNGAFERVLKHLLSDAWRQGATALRGRLEPDHIEEYSHRHCWFRREGTWTLVHSPNPDVIEALERGATTIGRLDGEWWLRFHGE
jgi:GNAT superfamily N-acetyltransferase